MKDPLRTEITIVIHDHTGKFVTRGSFWSWHAEFLWSNMMMANLDDTAYAEILNGWELA